MDLSLVSSDGKQSGKIAAPDEIFNVAENKHIVHSALVWYQACQRSGTHAAKTRGEVSGGGVKPWKQKGTGRARAGSTRSPLWRKGGVIFPPKPRDYSYALPKKMRKLALKVVLSERVRAGKVKVLEDIKVQSAKTKDMVKLLKGIGVAGKVLVLHDDIEASLDRAGRNIVGLRLLPALELNIFDLLSSQWVVLSRAAVEKLKEALK